MYSMNGKKTYVRILGSFTLIRTHISVILCILGNSNVSCRYSFVFIGLEKKISKSCNVRFHFT